MATRKQRQASIGAATAALHKPFRDFCLTHGITEHEGIVGALDMLVMGFGNKPPSRRFVSPIEIYSFRAEVLAGVFGYGLEGVPALMERAALVEKAHALWLEQAVPTRRS